MSHIRSLSENEKNRIDLDEGFSGDVARIAKRMKKQSQDERNRLSRKKIEAMVRTTAVANYPTKSAAEIEVIVSMRMGRHDMELAQLRNEKQAKKARRRQHAR